MSFDFVFDMTGALRRLQRINTEAVLVHRQTKGEICLISFYYELLSGS